MNIQEQLLSIEKEALVKICEASNQPELNDIRAFYTGKKSPLGEIMKSMASLSIEEKKIVGKLANEVKARIEQAVQEKQRYSPYNNRAHAQLYGSECSFHSDH